MRVDISSLPSKLPDTETIDTQAAAVRKVGTDSVDIRDDVQGHWAGLGAVFESPHQDKVFSAVETVMSPYIDDVGTTTGSAADALENFSSAISGMKSRYDTIKEQAASHNSLGASYLPEDYSEIGISLQEEVAAVRKLYDDAVKECADAISKLNPLISDSVSNGISDASAVLDIPDYASNGAKVLGMSAALLGINTGPLNFYVATGTENPFTAKGPGRTGAHVGSANTHVGSANTHRALGNSRLPTSFGALAANISNTHRKAGPPRYGKAVDGVFNAPARTVAKPGTAKHPEIKAELTRKTNPHRADGPARLPKSLDKVNKFANGPGGKALSVVGTGLSFAGAYTDGYNDSVIRNPGMTPAEHKVEAAKDATVAAGSEAVGSVVGTAVGRGAGAVVGQALIPIPGVGAAVGGIVGGMIGGYVGGEVGGAVGSTINDIRHGDVGSVGEAAKDVGKKVFSSLNPFD